MLNKCINLPKNWQNKTSSVLTNGCVVLFSEEDCKTDKSSQIFSSARLKFNDIYFSKPDNIPNYNFYNTW